MKKSSLFLTGGWCLVCILLFFPLFAQGEESVDIRYAKFFHVKKQDEYTLVEVSSPWAATDSSFHYLLKPRSSKTPAGYDAYQVVEVPIRSFVSLSTTYNAFIEQLDITDLLVGLSDLERINSRLIRKVVEKKNIVQVGRGGNLQIETILDLQPEMVFSFASGSFRDAHPKLLEAGLHVAVIGEYMESHPLGRAEWIKFLGLFTGREKEAEEIFTALEKRYLSLAALSNNVKYRPTVVRGTPFSGRWYVAGGKSYVGTFLHDAGADYIFKETQFTGSRPMDIELVYERGQAAEFWVNCGVWQNLDQARRADPRFAAFKSLQDGRVYNNNLRVNEQGGNDYWESGVMAPDLVLADMIHIFHPELLPDHQFVYYTQLH